MAGDGAPFAAEDVYSMAALEVLLGHGSHAHGGDSSQPGSGTAKAQAQTPTVPRAPDVEQPPDRSMPVAPPAGRSAADDPAHDDCECSCCFNSARGRRAWWLGAVVALTFTVQIALAVLVLWGALQVQMPSTSWLKPWGEVKDAIRHETTSTRDELVQKLYDEALKPIVCQEYHDEDRLCHNPFLAANCSCVVPVPESRAYYFWWDEEPYQGCAHPSCFLCWRNTTWRECHICMSVGGGKPQPAWEQQDASVAESISRRLFVMDGLSISRLERQLGLDGLDWSRAWPWRPRSPMDDLRDASQVSNSNQDSGMDPSARGVAVSVAVVLIAIYCHREVARAHRLARLVLTHTHCMPAFFTPLSLVGCGVPASRCVAAGLLLLPLLQLCTALAVLLAASTVFGLASQTKDPISMVFNSAALLFVLELDNVVGGMVAERTRTAACSGGREAPGEARVRERRMAAAGAWPARLLGHAYVALLGLACFAELLFATDFILRLYGNRATAVSWEAFRYAQWQLLQQLLARRETFISASRHTLAAICTFGPLYTLVVAVLFDPPLPTASVAWSIAARACMVAVSAAFSVMQMFGPQYVIDGMLQVALPCAAAPWLVLYALVPWARACHVARRP